MARRFITKETRVEQIARSGSRAEMESAVQTALNSLRAQIQAIYQMISEMKIAENAGHDERGEIAAAVPEGVVTAAMVNRSGAGRNHGEVATLHATVAGAFDVAGAEGDRAVVGVICADSPDGTSDAVADGAVGEVCVYGRTEVIVDADAEPVAAGDYLMASAEAGQAARASEGKEAGAFAVALEGKASGVGPVAALVTGPVLWAAREAAALRDFSRSLFEREGYLAPLYDDDGSLTGFSGYVAGVSLWTDAAMERLAARWSFGYDADGLLSGWSHSVYDSEGAPAATISRVVVMQQHRVSAIISEMS